MNTYMVNMQLPVELSTEFIMLIPKQRAHINDLMDRGKVIMYSLSMDRKSLWVIISAKSQKNAEIIISEFPLNRFMKSDIKELAFHNSVSTELPKLIMN